MKGSSTAPDFKDAALLIAAHGSPGSRGGQTSSRKHTASLANLGLFADVRAGFLTENPFANDVLNSLDAAEVYVVPNMTANGYIATQKLPQALGLTGKVTERIGPQGHQRIILTEPVGTHPLISRIIANRVKGVMNALGLDDDETALVVVGHGSTKSRESFTRTEGVANELRAHGLRLSTVTAYLEEPPFVKDWRDLSDAETIVFAPFLISDGFHGSKDIPLAIGFNPGDSAFESALAQGQINETVQDGRRIVYIPPVGEDPDMAEIILARVKQAHDATR